MIENMKWNSTHVQWVYGRHFQVEARNILDVWVDENKKWLMLQCGVDDETEQEYCYTFLGELVYGYDIVEGKIVWSADNLRQVYLCSGLQQACYSDEYKIILALTMENKAGYITGLNMLGEVQFKLKEPVGFKALYFSSFNDQISVVCESTVADLDKYGRNRKNFIVRLPYGQLEEGALAY